MESGDGKRGAHGAARRDELGGLCRFYRGRRRGNNGVVRAASLGEPCGASSCPESGGGGRRGCPGTLSGSELRGSLRAGEQGLTPLSPPHAAGAPRDSLSPVKPTSGTPLSFHRTRPGPSRSPSSSPRGPRCRSGSPGPSRRSPPAPLPPPGIAPPPSRDAGGGASRDTPRPIAARNPQPAWAPPPLSQYGGGVPAALSPKPQGRCWWPSVPWAPPPSVASLETSRGLSTELRNVRLHLLLDFLAPSCPRAGAWDGICPHASVVGAAHSGGIL